ncbi:MAG: AAA family ATPase, partial [Byssovorax sp.]
MTIEQLKLWEFSAFKEVELDFSPGVNVFLGANASGKSHAMKSLYAPLKTLEQNGGTTVPLEVRLHEKFANVFKTDEGFMGRLVRRRRGQSQGWITIKGTSGKIELTLNTRAGKPPVEVVTADWKSGAPAIFLPTREVLAMYEGFAAAYQDRELSFDETYYDACVA